MGNNYCSGAREKMEETRRDSVDYYRDLQRKMKRKLEKAKLKTKEGIQVVKLRAKGYSINNFDDNGETKVISDFENNLSLCMVPLDVFD